MIDMLGDHRKAIAEVCHRHGVARLEVFGSAMGDHFDEQRSDVDFLVEFSPDVDLGPWLSRYFDLKRELENIVGRRADLVMAGAVRNPFFIRELNRTRWTLYTAQDAQVS